MKYVAEYKDYLDEYLTNKSVIKPGKMFGYPAYYVNGKLAICHYEDNLIIKLPAQTVDELIKNDSNATKQGPKPRPNMGKEWVFLHINDISSLKNYKKIIDQSILFVAQNT